jgi:hypothetical protein
MINLDYSMPLKLNMAVPAKRDGRPHFPDGIRLAVSVLKAQFLLAT